MENKHTPGPWVASNNPGDWGLYGNWTVSVAPHDYDATIAEIPYQTPYCLGERQSVKDKASAACANARLIAAAPDLLKALEMIRDNETIRAVCPSPIWATITAAIAKARGQ